MMPPTFRMSLPTQPSLSGNTLLDTPRRVFPWGLEILPSCQDDQPPYNSSQSISYYPHPCGAVKISFFLGLSICTFTFEHRISLLSRKLCNGVMALSIVEIHIVLLPDIHGLSLKFQWVFISTLRKKQSCLGKKNCFLLKLIHLLPHSFYPNQTATLELRAAVAQPFGYSLHLIMQVFTVFWRGVGRGEGSREGDTRVAKELGWLPYFPFYFCLVLICSLVSPNYQLLGSEWKPRFQFCARRIHWVRLAICLRWHVFLLSRQDLLRL